MPRSKKLKTQKQTTLFLKWDKNLNRHLTKENIQVVNKLVQRCSTSYAIREIQTQTTVRLHHTPIRMAKVGDPDNTKCRQGHGAPGALVHCWWECRMLHFATLEDNLALSFSQHTLTINSASPLLGIYPKELKTYVCTQT